MVFNPLEQERLSIVPVLVDSPRVRVLSEEGQPLPSQLSAHWGSATDMVPDVYQVWGAPVPLPTPILRLHIPRVPASCPRTPPTARTPREPCSVATSVPTPQHKLPLLANPQTLPCTSPLSRGPRIAEPGSLPCRQPAGPHAPAALLWRGWLRSPCCPQVSVLARLPALGLRVLQLHKSFDGHATLKSSVRLHLHGRDLPVRKQEAVPVHVFPATADDFCLENQHLQACFSGHSGLLQVSAGV